MNNGSQTGPHPNNLEHVNEYVTLHGNKSFEGVIKSRTLRAESTLGYPGGSSVITGALMRQRQRLGAREGDVKTELQAHTSAGSTASRKWPGPGSRFFPGLQKEHGPANPLTSA